MRLTPFNLTQNISVDNALSTIQVIHQIITKVNNVVDYVNNLENNSNKYTDEQIANLLEQLENNLTTLENALKMYVDNKVDNLKSYVDNENNDIKTLIDNKVEKIYNDINGLEQSLKNYIDLNDTEIRLLIYEIKDELIKLINQGKEKVFSPFDGRSKSIQQALYDIFKIINLDYGNIIIAYGKKWFNDIIINVSNGSESIDVSPKTYTYGNMINLLQGTSSYKYCSIVDNKNNKNYTFIVFDRLDFSVRYPFMVLYYLCFNYMIYKKSMEPDTAGNELSTGLYQILAYGYNNFINTHNWNSLI